MAAENCCGIAAIETLKLLGVSSAGVSLRIQKGMPLGSGLGSSAASAAAACWAVNLLFGARRCFPAAFSSMVSLFSGFPGFQFPGFARPALVARSHSSPGSTCCLLALVARLRLSPALRTALPPLVRPLQLGRPAGRFSCRAALHMAARAHPRTQADIGHSHSSSAVAAVRCAVSGISASPNCTPPEALCA